jgi:hypothetical protein
VRPKQAKEYRRQEEWLTYLFYPKVSEEKYNPLLGVQECTYLLPVQESPFGWDVEDTVWRLAG